MNPIIRWAFICGIVLVIGCKGTDDIIGKGPVELTPQQASAFENWKNSGYPGALFFLTRNGGAFAVVCPAALASECNFSISGWHEECERRHASCKLYGMLDEVVWRLSATAERRAEQGDADAQRRAEQGDADAQFELYNRVRSPNVSVRLGRGDPSSGRQGTVAVSANKAASRAHFFRGPDDSTA